MTNQKNQPAESLGTCPNCGSAKRDERLMSHCVMMCPPPNWRWVTDSRANATDEIECCHWWHAQPTTRTDSAKGATTQLNEINGLSNERGFLGAGTDSVGAGEPQSESMREVLQNALSGQVRDSIVQKLMAHALREPAEKAIPCKLTLEIAYDLGSRSAKVGAQPETEERAAQIRQLIKNKYKGYHSNGEPDPPAVSLANDAYELGYEAGRGRSVSSPEVRSLAWKIVTKICMEKSREFEGLVDEVAEMLKWRSVSSPQTPPQIRQAIETLLDTTESLCEFKPENFCQGLKPHCSNCERMFAAIAILRASTPSSPEPERHNVFPPCQHDLAGERKDECVKCYPPDKEKRDDTRDRDISGDSTDRNRVRPETDSQFPAAEVAPIQSAPDWKHVYQDIDGCQWVKRRVAEAEIQAASSSNAAPWTCPFCKKPKPTERELKKHLRKHLYRDYDELRAERDRLRAELAIWKPVPKTDIGGTI